MFARNSKNGDRGEAQLESDTSTSNAISEKGIGDVEISEALTMLEIFRIKEIAMRLDRGRDDQ